MKGWNLDSKKEENIKHFRLNEKDAQNRQMLRVEMSPDGRKDLEANLRLSMQAKEEEGVYSG